MVDKLLSKYEILNKEFNESIMYNVLIDNDIIDKLQAIGNVTIKKEIIIKREI